jgi:CRP-like cAMP-binding protein
MPTQGDSGSNSVTTNSLDPRRNELLATLFRAGCERFEQHLEPLEMAPGQVLYEAGTQSEYVYFPITARVSLRFIMADGASAEIAAVGSEGIVGIGVSMAGSVAPGRASVQSGGVGFRLKAQMIRDELNRAGPVMDVILHYIQALIVQMVQNVSSRPLLS